MSGTGKTAGDASISRVMAALPERVRRHVDYTLREPRISQVELRRMVAEYLVELESRARYADYMDIGLATEVARICHLLIDTLVQPVEEEHHRLVQAAVRYFIIEDDAESDTDSLIGFDDDRLVAETVAAVLGISETG